MQMDKASKALAQRLPASVPRSFRTIADQTNVPRSTLHARARGRRSIEAKAQSQQYLTPAEEKAMVDFVLQMSALGTPVRIKYIPSIAFTVTRGRPESDRPIKPPGKNWAKSLEKRDPEIKARKVKALNWDRHEKNIFPKIEYWFQVIGKELKGSDIVQENVYNMDETRVMLSKLGYLEPMIIWPASTHRANWTTFPTPGWHYAFSDSGYADSIISLEWLTKVFDPQTSDRAGRKHRVLICDGFGTHESVEVMQYCLSHKIILCRLPSHTSHKLQPCDIAVFAPLKTAYRDNVERLERGGVNTIGKQHFTSLYSPARETAFTKRNILAGWSKGGLFPFNPQRVLRDLEKPFAALTEAAEPSTDSVSPPIAAPVTPVTPVCATSFAALRDAIVNGDACALDEVNKQKLDRNIGKLAKAAQISYARCTLQEDRIRGLLKINDEAKPRRSTRPLVLSTAKVISYEDLTAAFAKRAEQEEKAAARQKKAAEARARKAEREEKGKVTKKRKQTSRQRRRVAPPSARDLSTGPEARQTSDEPEMTINGDQVAKSDRGESPIAPCPGRAPTARMW
ncbi:hypothetical protein MBLNU13_g10373t1 [Cladosporium sp. NU13]